MIFSDTIVALATASGYSALAVIRVSGEQVIDVFGQEVKIKSPASRHVYYGHFYNQKNEIIDSLNFVFFPSPNSATGQDTLELYPHGNPLIIQQIIEVLLHKRHFRMAKPGEFTQRALENNKMDLLQAEALNEFIHGTNAIYLKNAQKILQGGLNTPIQALNSQINEMFVQLELDIDFVEEEVNPDYSSWENKICDIELQLHKLCQSWETSQYF